MSLPPLNQIVTDMLDLLRAHLPPISTPPSDVTLVRLKERPLGLGNRRGVRKLGAFGVLELKGTRLGGEVGFHLWSVTPELAEAAAATVIANLTGNRDALRQAGFLALNQGDASPAEFHDEPSAWRKRLHFDFLYEFQYADTDDALSLIARIPVHTDPETRNSPQRETNIVTDAMVRWDNESAPGLVLRGSRKVSGLSLLMFVSGAMPSGGIRVLRTFEGAGAATDFSGQPFGDFLQAVTHPQTPNRNASYTFSSISDFRDAFDPAGDPIRLGDWDEDGIADPYEPRSLALDPAIPLPDTADRIEIVPVTAPLDQPAVLYLKANTT